MAEDPISVPYGSKNRYVRISSVQKNNASDSSSNFSVNIVGEGGVIDNISSMYVKSISVGNVFPNVQTWNNLLILDNISTATSFGISVPLGQYNINTFITALQTNINANIGPNSVTITQDATTGKLIFTFAGANNFRFIYSGSTMAPLVGLLFNSLSSSGGPITMNSIPNLSGINQVYVNSQTLFGGGLISAAGAKNVVEIVEMDQPYGSIVYSKYIPEFNFVQYAPFQQNKSFRIVDIRLTDPQGNQLEWIGSNTNPNFSFEMILKIFYD